MKGFLSGTDVQRSLNLTDNRLINLYPTSNDDGSVGALVATPGLELYATIPSAAIASGIYTSTVGRCFMVAGTTLYEITAGGTLTSRGTVTAGTVSRMSDNGVELIIVNGTNGWLFTFATNVLAQITAAAFPNGCKTVSYMNGRFVVVEPNTQNMYVSDRLAGGTWDALNVATVDSNPDRVIGQIVSHNELIIFCEDSGEVWYDTDQYPVPFVRNESGIFEVGCISPYAITKIDNSVIWLGKSSTGLGVIYRLNGYTPTRISTYSIEYAIQQMTDTSDAIAFTYQQDGHHFYVITFPTGNKTFAYDVNTQMWHERANFSTVTGNFFRWEAQEYAYFDGKHLVCDYTEGKIYSLEMNVYTDGSDTRKWLRSWRAPATDMKRVVHSKLILEMESGVGLVGSGSYYVGTGLTTVWSSTDKSTYNTLSGGDLISTVSTALQPGGIRATAGKESGKYYWELTIDAVSDGATAVGVANRTADLSQMIGTEADSWIYRSYDGNKFNNYTNSAYGATFTAGDKISVLLDKDNNTLEFWKNGVTQGVAYTNVTGKAYPAWSNGPFGSTTGQVTANFGSTAFTYTIPTGYTTIIDTPILTESATLPRVMLRYSNDGGHNWSSELWRSMGAIGEFSKKVIWHRLGMTGEQPRVYEISGNTPVKTILLATYLE